jgi:Flp pilus assembly protein TadG
MGLATGGLRQAVDLFPRIRSADFQSALKTEWHSGCTSARQRILCRFSEQEGMTLHLLRRACKRLNDADGSNLVEAAIITPLLVLLTFSIVDFAGVFYAYLALENGVSQATRFGVTGNVMSDPAAPGASLSRVNSIKTAMRQATPTLTIDDAAFTFAHLSPGGTSWVGGSGGPGDIEKVTVNYLWTFWTPVMRPFFTDGRIMLTVDSAMKNESRFE